MLIYSVDGSSLRTKRKNVPHDSIQLEKEPDSCSLQSTDCFISVSHTPFPLGLHKGIPNLPNKIGV